MSTSTMREPDIHIYGIRHHGPGSARSVRAALGALQPDCILVEGPPDAAEVLPLLAHAAMQPPVALLIYAPEEPRKAALYPFAVFSPEWQALQFGLTHRIPVRFIDLPQAQMLALPPPELPAAPAEEGEEAAEAVLDCAPQDPIGRLAEIAGFSDGERWWEHMVEQRLDSADLFAAILEAMTELRAAQPTPEDTETLLREAHMRQCLRAARQEGFQRIAVVCGAWHAPALATMPPAKADAERLKGLAKIKVTATWAPWTYGRLTCWSGYGAGIEAPGWYHHLWDAGQRNLSATQVTITWLTRVAQLMREEDLDISTAHVIESTRLAETLATMRGRPLPGLPELNDAVLAVCCFGSDAPLQLIGEKLIVGDRLGTVPEETPAVPLQQDLQREQRRLRLPPEVAQRTLDLDLRNDTDLARSHLLHRLALLGIPWGQPERVTGKSGTFHELWRLQWQPEFAVGIIEASRWGNTLLDAATAFATEAADEVSDLPALTQLLDRVLLADLPDATAHLMTCLENLVAVASDVPALMGALPPLAQILRYGNVRQTDAGMVRHVVDGLVARICVNLPGACAALNDEAAAAMFDHLVAVHGALTLLREEAHLAAWQETLGKLADQQGLHGVLAGRACRLLHDGGLFTTEEVARRLHLALSTAVEPTQAGAWVEGLLRGSGLVLLHDDALWQVLDTWVAELPDDQFTVQLPLLRRTFATFATAERRQIGERVRRAMAPPPAQPPEQQSFNTEQANEALAGLEDLFGL